ncbi:MAG: sulfite exporter TauE/SafE family protein [Polyangiaceae bacterium]|nr:sulfite exporter TauE/SafE family protein [Polyangiaceae bacterium]
MLTATGLGLAGIVALAFTIEAALGFGATVVTVALGSMLLPLDTILPAFVPCNVLLSGYLVTRYRTAVDLRLVARRVFPPVLLAMPLGMLAFARLDERTLKIAFGAFVVLLATAELLGDRGAASGRKARPLGRLAALAMLATGGVVHGAFGTGGPMVVYVLGRELGSDKARFRATLSVIWLVLNAVLVASYAVGGHLDAASLTTTAWLALPLLGGMVAGEWIHGRIPAASFRVAVFALLGLVGAVLVVRNLAGA